MKKHCKRIGALLCALLVVATFFSCPAVNEESGTSKVAFYFTVIEDGSVPTLEKADYLFTYEWSGKAPTGFELLKAAEKEGKIFANAPTSEYGPFLAQLAFDADGDGKAPTWANKVEESLIDDGDKAFPTKSEDGVSYYWSYYITEKPEGELIYAPTGMGERLCFDGSIDYWVAAKWVSKSAE